MLSATKTLRQAGTTGASLPPVPALGALYEAGIRFRHGQIVMVTGRPGAGKSNLVQSMAVYWAKNHDIPCLYYSLDMDRFTAGVRQAAIVTGHKQEHISAEIGGPGEAYYEDELDGIPVDYCFDASPELPQIAEELDAYVELYDRWPGVIVIDNLLNIESGGEGNHADQKFVMKQLQGLARQTGATVFILHHAKEGAKDTTRPPTMADTDNKQNQIPEVILSVAHDDITGEMNIAALKVRVGARMDPGAERPYKIHCDFSTMVFSRYKPASAWTPTNWSDDDPTDY